MEMEMENNQCTTMTCIVCPIGCRMMVQDLGGGESYQVRGHQCSRGESYAIEEQTHPTRMLTTTVKLSRNKITRLPVKTAHPVPKALLHQCMEELNQLEVEGTVKLGQVLLKNVLNTGVDVVATRSA